MLENLLTRPEACAFFEMSRSTFATYSRHYPDFPKVQGIKNRHYQYKCAELILFFEKHAPQFAATVKARAEVAA